MNNKEAEKYFKDHDRTPCCNVKMKDYIIEMNGKDCWKAYCYACGAHWILSIDYYEAV